MTRNGMTRTGWMAVIVLAAMAGLAIVYAVSNLGQSPPERSAGPEGQEEIRLLIYVGTSMQKPMERIVEAYRRQAGIRITPSYGDSGEVLTQVQLSGLGEAAVLHEPFLTKAKQEGWSVQTYELAFMQPVIAVAKGNPKNIKGLRDFAREDIRVGITEARYTTSGQIVQQALADAGIAERVLARKPYQHKSSGHMAIQVIPGSSGRAELDAATLWDAVAAGHPDKLDIVRIEPDLMPKTFTDSEGVSYSDGKVAVGLFTLKTAKHPEQTQKFVEFILSPAGQRIWKEAGFNPIRPTNNDER